MDQTIHVHKEATGPDLFDVAAGSLPSKLSKKVGFVHSLVKCTLPVCKQAGYPEVGRIWCRNKLEQRQQQTTEEDRAGTGELSVPPQY